MSPLDLRREIDRLAGAVGVSALIEGVETYAVDRAMDLRRYWRCEVMDQERRAAEGEADQLDRVAWQLAQVDQVPWLDR